MIGIDTNLLLRLILNDDPAQTHLAKDFIESNCSETKPGFINLVALTECVWALEYVYKASRAEILASLQKLLTTAGLAVENPVIAETALETYARVKVDFADALISAINAGLGCEKTVTFDKAAIKAGVMTALR